MKVLYMGTPDFAVAPLLRIIADEHTVNAVVTKPDSQKGRGMKELYSPCKIAAIENGIEVLQPDTLRDFAFLQDLQRLDPDVIVVAAYGKILPEYILNYPKYGCINIHASLLPKYRGAAPIQWALINGEKETGITTMYMAKGIDTGDILLMEKTPIDDFDTAETLFLRLSKIGSDLITKTLLLIERGKLTRMKQDETLATYAPMIKKELGNIDFNKTASEIKNLVRGLYPWPSAYTEINGKKLKIVGLLAFDGEKTNHKNGEIIKDKTGKICIACENGYVQITELIPENGRKMTALAYLAGNKII